MLPSDGTKKLKRGGSGSSVGIAAPKFGVSEAKWSSCNTFIVSPITEHLMDIDMYAIPYILTRIWVDKYAPYMLIYHYIDRL